MTYQETLDWMFNRLPMYQNIGKTAYKADLTNTILLSNYLGNPECSLKCIHVAGTNGKGSTSHLIASVLQESGYKVGLYTSPHLKDYRERIKINGEMISEDFVCEFISEHKPFFESHQLSFFEMTVGLALVYFQSEKVDFAIIEVGLGGRLDSTNIISPLISVITNIGLDHTVFLGTTHEEIAGEKAGIIKPKTPVVIGEFTPVTKTVFEQKAQFEQAEIYFASELISEDYPCALLGDYQQHNKKTALQTLKVLNEKGMITSTVTNIKNGFLNVIKNTGLFGRWQLLQSQPLVICDTAHNAEGLLITMKQIQKQNFETLHVVLGIVNDKDLGSILPLFPKDAKYYFCKPAIPRGLDEAVLKMQAEKHELNGSLYRSVKEAYEDAINNASSRDFIYIGGSTFVVAEII